MPPFLALLAFLTAAGVTAEHVGIPTQDGTVLDAALVWPVGPATQPPVIALHGCGGPFPSRDGSWAVTLSRQEHAVLLPDSFGSRSLASQCREARRSVTQTGKRRQDAITAAAWLRAQPGIGQGGIALIGWSNGGGTVLATARQAPDLPAGLFSRFTAFYPGCNASARDKAWQPAAPMLILVGQADEWTPAEPCARLAARFPGRITLVTYPGAYHDFDAPDMPIRVRTGLATAPDGRAHVGTDERARRDALSLVPAFLRAAPCRRRRHRAGPRGTGSFLPPAARATGRASPR